MTADAAAPMTPARAVQLWIAVQTLKPVTTPGYDPAEHDAALQVLGERLLADRTLASGRLSDALQALMTNPRMGTAELSGSVFGGNAGYTLHVMWPLASIFAGRMPRKVSGSTGKSYVGWVDRIRRVVMRDLPLASVDDVAAVLDAVSDAYTGAILPAAATEVDPSRLVEEVVERGADDGPGIYVVTTPTYLAHPPFGWNADDPARHDFRYLNVSSELIRQPGLPEPYIVLAVVRAVGPDVDYEDLAGRIRRLLSEARHGPERDGTQRPPGAGEGWFITRLPLVLAVADVLGLQVALSDDQRATVNEMLSACQLPDWTLP